MSKILDDMTNMLSGAASAAQAMRDEIVQAIGVRIDEVLAKRNLVSREEFEIVRDMAILARRENDALRKELSKLKKQVAPRRTPKK